MRIPPSLVILPILIIIWVALIPQMLSESSKTVFIVAVIEAILLIVIVFYGFAKLGDLFRQS